MFGLFSCSSPISGGSSLNGNRQVNLTFICGEEESKVPIKKYEIDNYLTYLISECEIEMNESYLYTFIVSDLTKTQFEEKINAGVNEEGTYLFVCTDGVVELKSTSNDYATKFIDSASNNNFIIENWNSHIYFVFAESQDFEEFEKSCQISTDGGNARPIRTCRRPKPYQWKAHYSDLPGAKWYK